MQGYRPFGCIHGNYPTPPLNPSHAAWQHTCFKIYNSSNIAGTKNRSIVMEDKSMRRMFFLILLLACIAVPLAGCGGDGSGSSNGSLSGSGK